MTLRDHKLLAFMDVSVGNRGRMLLRKSAEIDLRDRFCLLNKSMPLHCNVPNSTVNVPLYAIGSLSR